MILTAHQPCYLPWLGLLHKIALADRFICYDHVQYSQGDYTAKNCIKTGQGRHWLIVPIKNGRKFKQSLKDLEIDNSSNWKSNHWKTIRTAYAQAPFFKRYEDFLEDFYSRDWEYLNLMNIKMLEWLLKMLGLSHKVECSSSLNITGRKSLGILEMCKQLNADMIILGEQGHNYIEKDLFEKENIRIVAQKYHHPVYKQMHGKFISHLSVLDLLFNCGDSSLDILMSGNLTPLDIRSFMVM